ncbi:MAG TPA: exodeoxyribonuclease VII large subunit [Chloroflexota bacterium]|nr:exodeoxyribonuclease VII large subunit [Chloroflexota bacterium]
MSEARVPIPQRTLRVGELTRYLKYLVQQDDLLSQLSVRGEIAEITRSASGHNYFTLKDDGNQIACVLFRREAAQQMREVQQLRKGLSVVVHGFLTIYEPRGAYQIYVERVLAQGEGEVARRIEELRARLAAEGLFAPERKRSIPRYPRTLALITSPGSQAYHDVLHRLRTQYPLVRVIEAGASVQGEGAADEMVLALDIVNRLTDADVILLVRGGGSPEELSAFNDERLARAVFASRIPVVTGIGHQTDESIVDLVADVRAATPSLAAAAAVPDLAGLVGEMAQLHREMSRSMRTRLTADRNRWLRANRQLLAARPETRLKARRRQAGVARGTLDRAMRQQLLAKRSRLSVLHGKLQALDPLAILGRGYALVQDAESGLVIRSIQAIAPGQDIAIRVADGTFGATVREK